MDLAINPALYGGPAPLWLGSGQVTRLQSPAGPEAAAAGQTRVLLWPQQAGVRVNTLLYLEGQPYRVEAVENLILHFRRVWRLTVRAVGEEASRTGERSRTSDLDVVADIATPSDSPSCEAVLLRENPIQQKAYRMDSCISFLINTGQGTA